MNQDSQNFSKEEVSIKELFFFVMKIFINLVQLSGIFFLLGTILLIISSQTGTYKSTFWIGINDVATEGKT